MSYSIGHIANQERPWFVIVFQSLNIYGKPNSHKPFRVNDIVKLFFWPSMGKTHFSLHLNLKHMNWTPTQ